MTELSPPINDGSSLLKIDLKALCDNYQTLSVASGAPQCAAVVKADGYGIGSVKAAEALREAGAKTFFVAHLSEALTLRRALPEPQIFVLNGYFPQSANAYKEARISPVLNTLEQVTHWAALPAADRAQGAALHVDTGMNRLGIRLEEVEATKKLLPDVELVMSHLTCADEPEHALNKQQLERFQAVRKEFPNARASLANSAGCFLGPDYGFDLARPGISLYGSFPGPKAHGLKPVVTLEARVLQLRHVPKGETVGYGASFVATRPTLIATLACGYADGFLRAGSSTHAAFEGVRYPLAGRISMDLMAVDVTDAPKTLKEGEMMELFGPTISIDEVAEKAGTIAYELLTGLGKRYQRVYGGA